MDLKRKMVVVLAIVFCISIGYTTYWLSYKVNCRFLPKSNETEKSLMSGENRGSDTKIEEYNNMKIISDKCIKQGLVKRSNTPSRKMSFVTNFVYLKDEDYNGKIFSEKGPEPNASAIEFRMKEMVHVLSNNLNHLFIEKVHILVKDPKAAEYLRSLQLKNSDKAIVQVLNRDVYVKDQFEYAGKCLLDEVVAITYQDVLFGEGWEKFNPGFFEGGQLLYVLTTHSAKSGFCGGKGRYTCDETYILYGTSDVFVFKVQERFSSYQLKQLENSTPNAHGMAEALVWLINKSNSHSLMPMNPCKVLFVHSHNCLSIHIRMTDQEPRMFGFPRFTDELAPYSL